MKKLLSLSLIIMLFLPVVSLADERVRGHWKDTDHDGAKDTYVNPYDRTSPNEKRTDNYSYPGNYNPNKGTYTPRSNSDKELYPSNPNPYNKKNKNQW